MKYAVLCVRLRHEICGVVCEAEASIMRCCVPGRSEPMIRVTDHEFFRIENLSVIVFTPAITHCDLIIMT